MRYKLLGGSGLRVSELSLGTMTFGENWGWGASADESRAMYDAYLEAGGNFIDTANRYTDGHSEQIVGDLIAADREHIVLATKYSLFMKKGDPNSAGNHRKNMVQAVEASLKRLKTDYIDLYWLHAWDGYTPLQEIMRAFDDLVSAGKILYAGISDTPAWVVSRANTIAELRGWTPFVGLQVEYSLIQRDIERELLPMARALDLAIAAWSPLGGGVLTGKYNQPKTGEPVRLQEGAARISERNLAIAGEVVKVAAEIGQPAAQVAIAWVRQQENGGVPIIPILGARHAEQLKQNIAALDLTLEAAHLARLDEASRIDLGWPHTFIGSDSVRDMVTAATWRDIDNHRIGRNG